MIQLFSIMVGVVLAILIKKNIPPYLSKLQYHLAGIALPIVSALIVAFLAAECVPMNSPYRALGLGYNAGSYFGLMLFGVIAYIITYYVTSSKN